MVKQSPHDAGIFAAGYETSFVVRLFISLPMFS
jgi:hypothetical protein